MPLQASWNVLVELIEKTEQPEFLNVKMLLNEEGEEDEEEDETI